MLSCSCSSSLCVVTLQVIIYSACVFRVQSFAPVNIHRFVELSAVIILCDDDCCFAVDMVLIFFLPQWCVCVCVHMFVHMYMLHMRVFVFACLYNKLQKPSLKGSKTSIQNCCILGY